MARSRNANKALKLKRQLEITRKILLRSLFAREYTGEIHMGRIRKENGRITKTV